MAGLSRQEFDERVAILRRFKQALRRQRDRFQSYLEQLEQYGSAGSADDDLEFHVAMEQSIVREISAFERTIEPLETLYQAHDPEGAREIPALRVALERTRDEVVRRTEHNRELLKQQIEQIRDEISTLRIVGTRPLAKASSYAAARTPGAESALVDVTA